MYMHCMFCAPFLASRSLPKLTQSVGTYLLETVCSQSMKLLSLEKSLEQANLIHCVYISNFILRKFQQTLIEHTCTRGTPKIPVWKWFRKHKQLVFRVVLGMFWSFLRFVQLALRLASSNYLTSCLPRMNSRQFQSSSARRDGEWCCNVTVQMSKCACRTAKGSCGGNRCLLLFNDYVRLKIRWIFHQNVVCNVYLLNFEVSPSLRVFVGAVAKLPFSHQDHSRNVKKLPHSGPRGWPSGNDAHWTCHGLLALLDFWMRFPILDEFVASTIQPP